MWTLRHLFFILPLLAPQQVMGQLAVKAPLTQAPPAKKTDSRLLLHDGRKGMWFPMASARLLLQDVALLPTLRRTLHITEGRLALEKDRTRLLSKHVVISEQIAGLWQKTATQQAKVLTRDSVWWRSPYLWTAVGCITGVAVTVSVVYAVNRSNMLR